MIESLPDRELTEPEIGKLRREGPIVDVIGGPDGLTSGIRITSEDSDCYHFVLRSPREEKWILYESMPQSADFEEQEECLQRFFNEHYPDDHGQNQCDHGGSDE